MNAFGPYFIGQKARGTAAAPTAVLNGDGLLDLSAKDTAGRDSSSARLGRHSLRASENWTNTAQGIGHQVLHDGKWDHRLGPRG